MKLSIKKTIVLSFLFAILAFSLISCGSSKQADPVDGTKISYDGKTIKWEAPKNAVSYLISVNGLSEVSTVSTSYGYNVRKTDDSVTVQIKSVGENGTPTDPAGRTFTRLATITNIEFDSNGVMSWEAVDGASGYIVEVNGTAHETTETNWSEFVVGQTNKARVKPITSDGSTFSDFSAEVTRNYLAAPTNIKYDGVMLSWNGSGVYATNGYDIYINNALYQSGVKYTSLQYNANNESFDIQIMALGDTGTNPRTFASPLSEVTRFSFLGLIEDLDVENGMLTWSPIEGASAYKVKFGTTERTVNDTKFALEAGRDYTIQVKPIIDDGSTFFSNYSAEKFIHVLKSPVLEWTNYDLSDGEARANIHWNLVNGAVTGYYVVVEFTPHDQPNSDPKVYEFNFGETNKDFPYAFTEAGNYIVKVQTIADPSTGRYFNSAYSSPIEVVRLSAPDSESINVTSSANYLANGFKVTFKKVTGAYGYKLYRDTAEIDQQSNELFDVKRSDIIELTDTDGDKINYSIQSIGNGNLSSIGGRNIVYVSSLRSNDAPFEITVMPTPTQLEFSGEAFKWLAVANANDGYFVSFNGGHEVKVEEYLLTNLNAGDGGEIYVVTRGDGHQVLPSPASETKNVYRLTAPTNIRVGVVGQTYDSTGNEGKLLWDEVLNANSYQVQFGNVDVPVDANTIDSIYDYISTNATSISMRSVGNYELGGTYYVTSPFSPTMQMIRYLAPTFPATVIQNGTLLWNAPANTNVNVYTPTYVIYDEDLYTFNGEKGLSQMSIYDQFEGGYDYTLYVQAIGDGVSYINSPKSDPISFTLLATPEVTRIDGGYQWYGVPNATKYQVFVEGEKVAEYTHVGVSTPYTWNLDLSKFPSTNKNYKIEVQAIGDNNRIVSSKPFEIQQYVLKASSPEFTLDYSEAHYDINGEIIVNITTESNYTLGYYFTVGGALRSDIISDLEYRYATHATGQFTVKVQAAGGIFDGQGTLYIASDPVEHPIILLTSPAINGINRDGVVSYGAVTYATNYHIVVSYLDEGGQLQTLEFDNDNKTTFTLGLGKCAAAKMSNYQKIEIYATGQSTISGAKVVDSLPGVYVRPHN